MYQPELPFGGKRANRFFWPEVTLIAAGTVAFGGETYALKAGRIYYGLALGAAALAAFAGAAKLHDVGLGIQPTARGLGSDMGAIEPASAGLVNEQLVIDFPTAPNLMMVEQGHSRPPAVQEQLVQFSA